MTEMIKLFERDLNQLIDEIEGYPDESSLWLTKEGINNSAGNLALHLIGNLNHFIGKVLGGSDYIRNREEEFTKKNVPKTQLITDVRKTNEMIKDVLPKLQTETLNANYPIDVFGYTMTTSYFIIHLHGHLTYHLGQINYHRRLLLT